MTHKIEVAGDAANAPTTHQTTSREIVPFSGLTDNKQFFTVAAQFALRGYDLSRIESDSRALFYVQRHCQARYFSSWHDVQSFLAQLGSAA